MISNDSTILKCLCLTMCLALPLARAADVPADHAEQMTKGMELFKSRVRALLSERCLKCHGGEKIKGEFDLATREGLLHGGEDGVSVIPGKSGESRFVKLLKHTEEPYMPKKEDKLPDDDIAQVAAWIDFGAPYDQPLIDKGKTKARDVVTADDKKFWSFLPLKRSEPPAVKNPAWPKTPVDNFVLATLDAKGLTPNPAAERRKLIRRLYFDLLGLPPDPDEVEAFVKDPDPQAYDKLVDRLLASPHYGERWARHWLDLCRFAESHGYEQDYDRPAAYHFRDFLIKALNEDMPYNRFVKLQLAGDELEPDNPLALMATGYLAAGTHATQITANQVEKERYDELDDMTATTGVSLLGMTIGCARCHDHKFDPIPQKDYYRMLATFTTTVRSEVDLDLKPEKNREAKEKFDAEHKPLVDALQKYEKEQLPAKVEKWLNDGAKLPQTQWQILEMASVKSVGGATLKLMDDGSYLASGTNPKFDTYTFVANTNVKDITGVRLEALADPSFVKNGPGRATNGNFALTDFRVTASPGDGKGTAVEMKLLNPKATFEQKNLPVKAAIDDDRKSAWAIDPEFGKNHAAAFEFDLPVGFDAGTVLTFTMKFENNDGHNIGRPRLSISTMPKPLTLSGDEASHKKLAEVKKALVIPADKRSDKEKAALLDWFKTSDSEWTRLNKLVQDHLGKAPKPEMTKVMISTEGLPAIRFHTQGADFFDKTYFLKRGDLNQKNGEATQGFMQVLMDSPEQEKHWQVPPPQGARTSFRRASLGNWITDVDQGAGRLLARVIVNRLWQHHFGRGIVSTPNDFGVQGDKPTHPELLDWLATELIQQGWHLKPLHKLILTSAVYMQGTEADAARTAIDPENTFLWRRSARRFEAEVIRDSMLAVSGRLDLTMYGPGSLDEGQRRRSIYFFTKRSKLIPLMTLFDAPDSLTSLGARSSTIVAPQAMALMNNPQIRECAKSFAKKVAPKPDTALPDAVQNGYRLALSRAPDADELADSLAFLQSQQDAYKAGGKTNAGELAMTDFCQALMSLNEFVFDQ